VSRACPEKCLSNGWGRESAQLLLDLRPGGVRGGWFSRRVADVDESVAVAVVEPSLPVNTCGGADRRGQAAIRRADTQRAAALRACCSAARRLASTSALMRLGWKRATSTSVMPPNRSQSRKYARNSGSSRTRSTPPPHRSTARAATAVSISVTSAQRIGRLRLRSSKPPCGDSLRHPPAQLVDAIPRSGRRTETTSNTSTRGSPSTR
jgi:hypothetical protein